MRAGARWVPGPSVGWGQVGVAPRGQPCVGLTLLSDASDFLLVVPLAERTQSRGHGAWMRQRGAGLCAEEGTGHNAAAPAPWLSPLPHSLLASRMSWFSNPKRPPSPGMIGSKVTDNPTSKCYCSLENRLKTKKSNLGQIYETKAKLLVQLEVPERLNEVVKKKTKKKPLFLL